MIGHAISHMGTTPITLSQIARLPDLLNPSFTLVIDNPKLAP
jgi:hypothetical protein